MQHKKNCDEVQPYCEIKSFGKNAMSCQMEEQADPGKVCERKKN